MVRPNDLSEEFRKDSLAKLYIDECLKIEEAIDAAILKAYVHKTNPACASFHDSELLHPNSLSDTLIKYKNVGWIVTTGRPGSSALFIEVRIDVWNTIITKS